MMIRIYTDPAGRVTAVHDGEDWTTEWEELDATDLVTCDACEELHIHGEPCEGCAEEEE